MEVFIRLRMDPGSESMGCVITPTSAIGKQNSRDLGNSILFEPCTFTGVLVMILLTFTWLCTRAVFPHTVLKYGTVVEFRQSEDNELTLILVVIVLGCFSLVEGVCPEEGFGRA